DIPGKSTVRPQSQGVAVQVQGTGQTDTVTAVKGLICRQCDRQSDSRHARGGGGRLKDDPAGQGDCVPAQLVVDAGESQRVEGGAGGEVIDVGEPLRGFGEDQVIAGVGGHVADPVGGGGPVVVGAAAVPGGDGGGEARLQTVEAEHGGLHGVARWGETA